MEKRLGGLALVWMMCLLAGCGGGSPSPSPSNTTYTLGGDCFRADLRRECDSPEQRWQRVNAQCQWLVLVFDGPDLWQYLRRHGAISDAGTVMLG